MKWLFAISLLFSFGLRDVQANSDITLCYEDVPVYPWITGDDAGLAITEIHLVEKALNMKFKLIRLPWKRCQLEAKVGKVDGLIAASYNTERAEWGVYPTTNEGLPDEKYRMHTDSFIVLVRKDSKILWRNNKFENLGNDAIGVQLGYSVGTNLKDAGYQTHSSFSTTTDLLHALDNKTLHVAVLQNYSTSKILSENPRLEKHIKRMKEPYKVVDQYLLFTKAFYEKNQETVKKIWGAIPAAREHAEYVKLEKKLMGKKSR